MFSFVSLGLVCMTFFLSCETNHQDEEQQLDTAIEIPEKIISNADAAVLFQNDHNTRLSKIGKEKISFKDKAIHFGLAKLTDYIEHLEAIAIARNIPITGVNFIFGVSNEGNRTTFLMPSTRNAKLDYQESFTIENGQFLTFKHIQKTVHVRESSINDENLILSTDGYISFNEASILFNRFEMQYIQPFASKVAKEFYTKAVWYSLDEIKCYMSYIQKRSNEFDLKITGIDVFFGVYDTNADLELKSNAQTVFLVASNQKQSIINTKKVTLQSFTQNNFYTKETSSDEENESLTFNEGQLSPPPKNN